MKYLAIDLGLKRIGLAYSAHKDIVTPLPAVMRKNRNQAASEVQKAIKEWQVDALVVGLPLGGSSEDEMRRRVKHFVNLLEFEGEVFFQDESGSSLEAKALLKGEMRYIRDGRVDSLAAMVILQRFKNSYFL
ncbi:MAG: Holliday junction resolvase RuvX [Epsilonproteobacteria bacterium]|nr:Holliday junction resolvase RuvX [Campylobacterota bacterium]